MALKSSSLKSGLSLTLGRMTLGELYQSAEKDCDDVFCGCDMPNLEDVSRSSIISIATGKESTRSSIIVEIETVAEVMEPACHALGHCVQATSVVEKMKNITKGYRLVNRHDLETLACQTNIGMHYKSLIRNNHVHFQLRRKALNLS
jgi:hypothetical protein